MENTTITLKRPAATLVVIGMLVTLVLACGSKEASIPVPAGAQAGDLVGLEPCTYEASKVEDVGLGWPALAKLLLAVVVLVPILLLVLAWLITRWVKRRRAGRVPG